MSDSESDFTEHTLGSKTVYRGRILHVLEDEVRMPDGKSGRREYIRHPGAVAMIPMLDAETVVLVRQYRYPARRHFYEIPAGKIVPGEEPADGKARAARSAATGAGVAAHDADPHRLPDERIELQRRT
jgi:ADP-ribose pyrophosphatase